MSNRRSMEPFNQVMRPDSQWAVAVAEPWCQNAFIRGVCPKSRGLQASSQLRVSRDSTTRGNFLMDLKLYTFFVTQGYIYDWIGAGTLLLVSLLVPCSKIMPIQRFYISNDPTLSYPDQPGTISSTVLYILVFFPPSVVFLSLFVHKRSLVDLHHALLSMLESFSLATAFKRWMNLVGILRPHSLAVFDSGDKAAIQDTRQSYPSGHSAYMFSTSCLLTLYLIGHLRLISAPRSGQFIFAFLCLSPVILATFVALTRIYDFEHAPADVNCGCFIGIASSLLAYHLNFHPIMSARSHEPRQRSQGNGEEKQGYLPTERDSQAHRMDERVINNM